MPNGNSHDRRIEAREARRIQVKAGPNPNVHSPNRDVPSGGVAKASDIKRNEAKQDSPWREVLDYAPPSTLRGFVGFLFEAGGFQLVTSGHPWIGDVFFLAGCLILQIKLSLDKKKLSRTPRIYLRLVALAVTGVFILFGHLLNPYQASFDEIASAAARFTVALTNDPAVEKIGETREKTYVATGLAISRDWTIATCADAFNDAIDREKITVAVPLPFGGAKQVIKAETVYGATFVPGLKKKDRYGIALLQIGYSIENGDGVAVFEKRLPRIGESIFFYGLENQDSLPSFTVHQGMVLGIGNGPKTISRRFSISAPYKPSYCGAPVFDQSASLVGMMSGGDSTGSQFLAGRDITNLFVEAGRKSGK